MEIEYVAADSMGVKSMCTRVETGDTTVTVDPGIAIEAGSFPLPREEKENLVQRYREKIIQSCRKSEFIVITHYHFDHFRLNEELFEGKKLLVKNPNENINKSQSQRAADLEELIQEKVESIEYVDGKEKKIGDTKIRFSRPLYHGKEETNLGFVLMTEVMEDKHFLYSSDLNGIYMQEHADLIIEKNPDVLVLDGFPTYLIGMFASYKFLRKSLEHMVKILENTDCEQYVIDHHLLRDYRYPEFYHEVYEKAKELGKNVSTMAELKGEKPMVLRGYEENGPSKWKNWEKLTIEDLKKEGY